MGKSELREVKFDGYKSFVYYSDETFDGKLSIRVFVPTQDAFEVGQRDIDNNLTLSEMQVYEARNMKPKLEHINSKLKDAKIWLRKNGFDLEKE